MPRRSSRRETTLETAGRMAAVIGEHPREFVALLMATVATFAIFVNALFLQKGPHPAPIFAARPMLAREEAAIPPRIQGVQPNAGGRDLGFGAHADDRQHSARADPQGFLRRPGGRHLGLEDRHCGARFRAGREHQDQSGSERHLAARDHGVECEGGEHDGGAGAGGSDRQVDRAVQARDGGAARARRFRLRADQAERSVRSGDQGRDREVRARPQAADDRADLRPAGARARRNDGPTVGVTGVVPIACATPSPCD